MEPWAAGQVLAGRFRLIRRLGAGGAGEVWLAEALADGREVALKLAVGGADVARLREEFAAASRLVHPGIVRVEELVDTSPVFLVLQFVPGATSIGTLRGASWRDILAVLLGVAEALEYAHRQGVVHRDLKASNVLRTADGRCLVTDFGTAMAAGGGSLPGMSPQQLDGAPPAVADDVYAFGALLYDLLTGQPLFHPDVSAARIRDEVPALPVADLGGSPLPEPLRRWLAVLLAKLPAARPPGMAAVRAGIEEILRDGPTVADPDLIRPLDRARVANEAAALPRLRRERHGLPGGVVAAALGALVLVALAVVFYLPRWVEERGPVVRIAPAPGASPPPVAAAPETPAAPVVPQAALDEALGEFLRADEAARAVHAERWAGPDWTRLREVAAAADTAYRQRDAAAALTGYREAARLARALESRAPAVRDEALQAGAAALAAGDQPGAIAQYERALAVSSDHAGAARGLERARQLDRLLALMAEAGAAEAAGDRTAALVLYRKAATLDPAWPAASEAVARLGAAAARDTYETAMARGLAAQTAGDLAGARAAFAAALAARPGDEAAMTAAAQVQTEQRLAGLASKLAQARALEQAERWAEALAQYESVLAEDAGLADAQAGRERARARADLDQRLRRELGNADRFNDDAVLAGARGVLAAARAVPDPGPVLVRQAAELDALLAAAVVPVTVAFESDGLTQVTLFKVSRLGAFTSRTLSLRPGAYTAVGSRPGYRDVRRAFRVVPGGIAPVVVRCEEPI
ncbi:MAG: serine/threonine protein kinase [Gammaproteobacteria bacterium]|nr:serine/threonine protein kinase [Gammaproteobacteria bacterium]